MGFCPKKKKSLWKVFEGTEDPKLGKFVVFTIGTSELRSLLNLSERLVRVIND